MCGPWFSTRKKNVFCIEKNNQLNNNANELFIFPNFLAYCICHLFYGGGNNELNNAVDKSLTFHSLLKIRLQSDQDYFRKS